MMKQQYRRNGWVKLVVASWATAMSTAVWSRAEDLQAQRLNQTTIGSMTFTVAPGLQFERVVDESLIQWPIAATFADNGDLLVLECHWVRETVKAQLESRPHKIVRLSDTDKDGKFDRRTVIADRLGFPEGIMVFGKDLLVTAPPEILRLIDRDGDGIYESREVWFDGTSLTPCANDLHGPMMGPDGWVYWTKGAFAEQKHAMIGRPGQYPDDGAPSKASHIYRRHPTGGPIERLMTGGMDNPSDLTFSPEGQIFFCSTFLHHPGNGLRDGLAHSPRGGLFGKPHQVLDGHKTTGPLLDPMTQLGPAAPASVNFLETDTLPLATSWFGNSEALPSDTSGFLVSCQFNLQRVALHQLVPKGASYTTVNRDLVTADRIDFHPTDTLEEPNGSLLVFDTGGWYDLCCPSSGKDKDIARGGIYRLSPLSNQASRSIPSPLSLTSAKQIVLDSKKSVRERQQALWVIAREITQQPQQPELARTIIDLLNDADPNLQQTAAHVVALNRWTEAKPNLIHMLSNPSPSVVRSAMEALGTVGDRTCIQPILSAGTRFPMDRFIVHATIYALMELGDSEELVRIASQTNQSFQKHATLHALNQMNTLPDSLIPLLVQSLASPDANLRGLAIQCLSRRPQATALSLPYLQSAWEREDVDALAFATPLIVSGMGQKDLSQQMRRWLLEGMDGSSPRSDWVRECLRQCNAESIPSDWIAPIVNAIETAKSEATVLRIAASIQNTKFKNEDRETIAAALVRAAEQSLDQPKTAIALLAACPSSNLMIPNALSELIVDRIADTDEADAASAAMALARCSIASDAGPSLVEALGKVPPLYLQNAIDALWRMNDQKIDQTMMQKLANVPATKTLSLDRSSASLSKRSDTFKQQWMEMMRVASQPPDDIAKSLDDWLTRLPPGDPAKGYHVFRSAKAACSSCHQVGYIGGRLGPELSKIGKSRTRRDLIEAVVFPSLRMAQGYYPVRIQTVDDEVINGLLAKATDTYVELQCGVDKVCRVLKSDIVEQRESQVSIMPTGLDQQMTLTEFADLIAFLESKK
jgi:putative membrane-bound dehydrogenase-like protein